MSRSRLCGGSPADRAMPVDRTPPTKRSNDLHEVSTPRRKNATTGYAPKADDQNTHDIVQAALAQYAKQFEERHAHLEAKHAKETAERENAIRQQMIDFMTNAKAEMDAKIADSTSAMRINHDREVQSKNA